MVGRCEAGEGVVLLLDGEPVDLGGWEHFAERRTACAPGGDR